MLILFQTDAHTNKHIHPGKCIHTHTDKNVQTSYKHTRIEKRMVRRALVGWRGGGDGEPNIESGIGSEIDTERIRERGKKVRQG